MNSLSIKIFNSLYSANKYAKKHGYEIPEYFTLVYTNQELYNRLEREGENEWHSNNTNLCGTCARHSHTRIFS